VAPVLGIVSRLRAAGVATEFYYEEDRLKKQFQYAERKGIPFCVLAGPDELARGEANVKELATGVQQAVPLPDLPARLRAAVQRGA
jgi:histidyl-tRNA synthetase